MQYSYCSQKYSIKTFGVKTSERITFGCNWNRALAGGGFINPEKTTWTFSYNAHLEENPTTGAVLIYMPSGRRDLFVPDGSGGYTRPYKVFNTLTKLGANHFELRYPNDTTYIFQIPSGTSAVYPLLTEKRNARGQALIFGYNAAAQLITVTDALGRVTTLTYSGDKVTRVDDPFGRHADFAYDANGDLTRITDMGGYWTAMTYGAGSYIASKQDARGTTGFLIESRDTNTATSTYPVPGAAMQQHYRITITHPDAKKSEYFYNASTGYSWYINRKNYVPYTSATQNNAAASVPKKLYYYTATSRGPREAIRSIVTPGGKSKTYSYDATTGRRLSVANTNGHTKAYTYNAMGKRTSKARELRAPVNYIYAANQVDRIEIQRPGLGSIRKAYNAHHQVVRKEDRMGNVILKTYNAQGNIARVEATANGETVATDYEYYGSGESSPFALKEVRRNGQVVAEYTYDALGRGRTKRDATGLLLAYEYNDLNHITRITYPDGKFISYAYSSCCPRIVDSITDRNGRTTFFSYDDAKRLIESQSPSGQRMRYEYDANGNCTKLIDANSQTTRFEYDIDNRLIKKIFADGHFITYQYNAAGKLSKTIGGRGISTEYHYDANNRLIGVFYSDNTPSVTMQYDDFGRLTRMTDGIGITNYSYDANSRPITADGPWPNDSLTYAYDELDRLTGVTPQTGQALAYNYDMLSRLTQIQAGASAFAYEYSTANSPVVKKLTRPGGGNTNYQHDTLNRLIAIENRTSANMPINSNTFAYNDVDLIGTETQNTNDQIDGFQQGMTTYDYNKVNQLMNSENPNQTFEHDHDGNMIKGYTPQGYIFRAAYDAVNRLVILTYTDDNEVVHKKEFVYAADSFIRILREYENDQKVQEIRVLRNGLLPLQDRDQNNNIIREYAWGQSAGGGIGGLLAMRQNGQEYHYLHDGKGNVSAVVDSAQAVVASYRYDTFGRPMARSGPLEQPFQFSTKRYLADTGLNYYGYRFYSPTIGRWINRDPLEEAGGINLYGFVQNNPVNSIDEFGLQDQWHGHNEPEFRDWVHKEKQRDGLPGDFNYPKDKLKELKEEWLDLECPRGKGGKSGKGGSSRGGGRGGGGRGGGARGGGGRGGGCFLGDTKVLTAEGLKGIKEIRIGEYLLTLNETTDINEYKKVAKVFQEQANDFVKIILDVAEIVVTPRHRFFVKDKGWTQAKDIIVGNCLEAAPDGDCIVVEAIMFQAENLPVVVYNLEIEDNPNYFVSDGMILAHNLKDGGYGVPGKYSNGACFTSSTLIPTINGMKKIGDVEVGDIVKTVDKRTMDIEFRRVVKKYGKLTDNYYKIHLPGETISSSDNHRYWVVDSSWVKASELKIGDRLLSANGPVMIEKIEYVITYDLAEVFNIEVESNENYLVGNLGVFVVDRWPTD